MKKSTLSAAADSAAHQGHAPRSRPVRQSVHHLSALILWLLPGLALTAAGPNAAAVFAEPLSGQKVTQYQVDLATDRTHKTRFRIPGQCSEVTAALVAGKAYRGSVVDRRIWQKVESDCRYHLFLHRHPQRQLQDHVSDYDFFNASLHDLPTAPRCAPGAGSNDPAVCNPTSRDASGMLRYFPLGESIDRLPANATEITCGLDKGLFRGQVYVTDDGISCTTAPGTPDLRLIAVDFADVNGDRVLDAVLRFIPLGPGAVRSPLILPLTRFSGDEGFSVPNWQAPAGDD